MSDEPERKPLDARRPCARCGRSFLSHVPAAKFCTMVCRRKADKERQEAPRWPVLPKEEG